MSKKRRADVLSVEAGLFTSRAKASEEIKAGNLVADGARVTKPSALLDPGANLTVTGIKVPYVSRGGLKLAAALDEFKISVKGCVCLDVGASTGGFTQVLLERGGVHVVAVDVGTGQLARDIAEDTRVTSLEGTDARNLNMDLVPSAPDVITADVSFISLSKALPHALALARKGAHLVALIKPQFEVGRKNVASGGIVRDEALQTKACDDIVAWLQGEGWAVQGVMPSPIEGGGGNKEFLVIAKKT